MLKFNLQLFGGGKKSKVVSTSAKVPEASSEEKQVLANEMGWLSNALGVSKNLMNLANGQLNNNQVAPDYNSLLQGALSGTRQAGQTVSGLIPQVQNGVAGANNSNNGYIGGIGNAMQTYQEGNKYLDGDYQRAMADNAGIMSGLLSGDLPSAYAQNRQKALQSDLDATMGSTLSSLADRGIINSSVANQSMNDISKNAMKEDAVLKILRNVSLGMISIKEYALPLSYIILNKNFMYINPDTFDIQFLYLPVEGEASVSSEFKSFVRQFIANLKYNVDEDLI